MYNQPFGSWIKWKGESNTRDNLIEFELENFIFKDYRAYTDLKIKVTSNGRDVLSKTYHAEGEAKGGQMWMAGPFGMKNATLTSTKSSIDKILIEFIEDLNNQQLSLKAASQ